MSRHQLYLLTPWNEGDKGPYYCPDCGVVEGFFVYTPQARDMVEIIHLEYPRPRPALVDLLGEENQSSPVLVLDLNLDSNQNLNQDLGSGLPEGGKKSLTTGRVFIDDPIAICNFLGQLVETPVLPHP